MGRVGPECRGEVIDISLVADIFPIEKSTGLPSCRMDSRDLERPNKLRSEKRADWSSGSMWPISHVGCTDDMRDTRRERAVSTSSTSLCS
jgi:hypothetical protein